MSLLHRKKRDSGAALLTVLVAMMIITIMLFEFQYSAMVERKLAYNELNQLQAYYLAKSGVRIGLLRVALFARARKAKELKGLEQQGIPISQYLDLIWSLPLPPFPPDKAKVEALDKPDQDAAEKVLAETHVEDGRSTHVITSEGGKINLNFLLLSAKDREERVTFPDPPRTPWQYVGRMLMNLIDNFIAESDDAFEEYGNIKPEEVVLDIMDWINPGETRFGGGGKDAYYEQQKPPYKAKRHRFYSLDELKLVRGIDDRLYQKLRPHITVFSEDGKINLNTASTGIYRALYRDFTEDDLKKIIEERDKMGGWPSEKSFVEFVSGTLGRSGFKSTYSDEKNYPFTVASSAFVIEAMGALVRSGSQIQKVIRVAVALTSGKGGTVDSSVTSEADCRKGNKFWDARDNQCKNPPNTDEECINLVGQVFVDNGQKVCKLPGGQLGSYPAIPMGGAKGPAQADASAMKILFWSES